MNQEHSKLGIIDNPIQLSSINSIINMEEYGVSGVAQETITTYGAPNKPGSGGIIECCCCCGGGAGRLEEENIIL